MDAETELATDILILDYTCYKATHALILRRIAELSDRSIPEHEESSNRLLSIFDYYNTLIEHKHKHKHNIRVDNSALSRDMHAKLELLTFTRLFFSRARQNRLNNNNNDINSQHDTATAAKSFSATDYAAMLDVLKIPRKDRCRLADGHQVKSLIDLYPAFVRLCSAMMSASSSSSSRSVTDKVVGKYLLQSALEQYSIFNRPASEAVSLVQQLGEGTEMKWRTAEYLDLLSPPPPPAKSTGRGRKEALEAHFNRLAQYFPMFEFECMMIMQLQEFLFGLDTPVLVKREMDDSRTDYMEWN